MVYIYEPSDDLSIDISDICISFLMSFVELIGIDYLINVLLSKMISSSIEYRFNFYAAILELVLMISITLITGIIVSTSLLIKDKFEKKHL